MSMPQKTAGSSDIIYPDSDGRPMADNTVQFRWIVTIKENLDWMFRFDPDVFVAGDLLWYPVEGNNRLRVAPDVLVALGRPKGDRGSYRQWVEGGIAPQVVFEILSPGNRPAVMGRKRQFYRQYGVQEYYVYDPDRREFHAWFRKGNRFQKVADPQGWVSPLLGIRFEMHDGELVIFDRDGQRFVTPMELGEQRAQAERRRQQAEQAREQAEREKEQERQRAEWLAERLRALGVDPESV